MVKSSTIKTKRLLIRPVRLNDAKVIATLINNIIIARNLGTISYPYKINDARIWLKRTLAEKRKKVPAKIDFIIEVNGQVAGGIGLFDIKEKHKAEIGYWLGKKYWSKGLMGEAVRAITMHGINCFKLKRIYAGIPSHNKPSMKVLEKCGYELEGIERKSRQVGRRYYDSYMYAYIK